MEKAFMTLPPPRDIPNGRGFLFQMENDAEAGYRQATGKTTA
jgi:hypothetical protein